MKLKDIAKVACRTLSIYTFIRFIIQSQYVFSLLNSMIKQNFSIVDSLWYSISTALLGILSAVLWSNAEKISIRMTEDIVTHKEEEVHSCWSYDKLQLIVFNIIGIIVLTNAVPNMIRYLVSLYSFKKSVMIGNVYIERIMLQDFFPALIGSIVQTILGLWLILGAKGVIGLIELTRGGIKD